MPQDKNPNPETLYIDAKGLKCPMPVIKLQQTIRPLKKGQVVSIDCTDPGAEKDISSWCKVNRHAINQIETTHFGYRIFITAFSA